MFLTNNQADKMNFLSGLIVIYNRMNNSHTSISGREDRSKTIQTIFLLGFLLYGFTVTAEKINCDVPVCSTESYRSKTNTLTAGQDTVVFRFAPRRCMFWADYKGNAAAIDSLTRSIRQHKFSIESGDIKVRVLGFCSSYDSFKKNLAIAKTEVTRSNPILSFTKD